LNIYFHSDYFESLPPWRSVSVTRVAEPAPSDTVDETIRVDHYQYRADNHPEDSGIQHTPVLISVTIGG
jgi:hypothetical protein